jgi:hypothetical protein
MGECAEEALLRRADSTKSNPKGAQASASPSSKILSASLPLRSSALKSFVHFVLFVAKDLSQVIYARKFDIINKPCKR